MKEATIDLKIDMRHIWRFHSDRGKEFMGALDEWLRDQCIVHTTTPGYDSAANGIAQRAIQEITQGIRCLLHQAGAPRELWAEAARHFCDILNRTMCRMPGGAMKVPIVAEQEEITGDACDLHSDDDPTRWPPWGCRVIALVPKELRDAKLDAVAVLGIFLGYDKCVVGGVRVCVL